MIIPERKEEVGRIVRAFYEDALKEGHRRARNGRVITTTEGQLAECISKATEKSIVNVLSRLGGQPNAEHSPKRPSWADVAAAGTRQTHQPTAPLAKVIPARHAREIVVRVGQQPADLA